MWNHGLARLKAELSAIQIDRNNVRFERDQAGNANNFRIGFAIRPCRKTCVADVVVAAEAFVGAKGLMFHEGKSGLIDVGTRNVPARSKTGLVEDQRPLTVRDDSVAITNHEMARSLADVNSMVTVGSMAQDPFLFFVKGVHGPPSKRDPRTKIARKGGEVHVLPRSAWCTLTTGFNQVPGSLPQIRMFCDVLAAL